MTISRDAEETFDKIQHPFRIKKKNSYQRVIEGTYVNLIKAVYDGLTANMISTVKVESLPAKFWNKTRMPTLTTSIQLGIDTSNHSSQTRKKKVIQIGKEEVKLSLFADDMILYIKNPKDVTKC